MTGSTGRLPRSGRAMLMISLLLAATVVCGVISRSGFARGSSGWSGRHRILRVWDWWSPATDEKYAGYFSEVKGEFQRLHPDVEVVFQYVPFPQYEQKMATAMAGNSPPDVFQSSVAFAEGFNDRGMLLPLNRFLERERGNPPANSSEVVQKEAFLEAAWRHNTKPDGTVFGIPQILDASCLAWNLDLLRRAADSDPEIRRMFFRRDDGSIDYNRLRFEPVADWEQFRRIARKLTKYDAGGRIAQDSSGEYVQAGFAIHAHGSGADPFNPWMAANGVDFQDSTGTRAQFNCPAGLEAAQFLLDLYWTDHVSPPFRRQLSDDEVFNQGKTACIVTGTWAGKYITRDTDGKLKFDLTPFPPGPHGHGPSALTWGNMLVISRRTPDPELAWEYVKFITTKSGALRLLRHIEQNSPRRDFYETDEWRRTCEKKPYLWNIPGICASGRKLRHTQVNAINFASQPIFESLLLRYPEIKAGRGPYPRVQAALDQAAAAVNRVYARYNSQVANWRKRDR